MAVGSYEVRQPLSFVADRVAGDAPDLAVCREDVIPGHGLATAQVRIVIAMARSFGAELGLNVPHRTDRWQGSTYLRIFTVAPDENRHARTWTAPQVERPLAHRLPLVVGPVPASSLRLELGRDITKDGTPQDCR